MKKFLRRLCRAVVGLIGLVAAFYVVENWRGKYAWEKYRHEREALGDSFEWSSIVPPPVPDAENFAATPLFAELFPKSPEHPHLAAAKLPECPTAAGNWRVGRVENLAAWQTCFSNDNLLAALSKYDPILTEIADASHRPKCRFPIRYEDNYRARHPHLRHLLQLAGDYRLRALAELAAGQTDRALADVRFCLRLANFLEDEPLLVSYNVRNGIQGILDLAIQPVWEGLAAHRWTNAQLDVLQAEFGRVDQFNTLAKAMRGERLSSFDVISWAIKQPVRVRVKLLQTSEDTRTESYAFGVAPIGWWYRNLLTADRFHTETYLLAIDAEHRMIKPLLVSKIDNTISVTTPYNVLWKLIIPSVASIAKKTAQSQTALDQVVTACALERYRLAKGELPEKLDALVPAFIAKVPHDVIDGQPLRYRRTAADQFVLYSVGWDETDDGGQIVLPHDKSSRPDFDKGDWVWSSDRLE